MSNPPIFSGVNNGDDERVETSHVEAMILRMLQEASPVSANSNDDDDNENGDDNGNGTGPWNGRASLLNPSPIRVTFFGSDFPSAPDVLYPRPQYPRYNMYDNEREGGDSDDEDGEGEREDDDMIIDETVNTVVHSFVPCEVCHEMIEFDAYASHLESCIVRDSVIDSTLPQINAQARNGIFMLPRRGGEHDMRMFSSFIRSRQLPTAFYDSRNDTVAEIGMRLMQALHTGNEYQYNLLMQELMGGPVRIGVEDIDAVCPIVQDAEVPPVTVCTICLSALPIPVPAASVSEAPDAPEAPEVPEASEVPEAHQEPDASEAHQEPEAPKVHVTATRRTLCDHFFCDPCIQIWLSEHKTCPNCLCELS